MDEDRQQSGQQSGQQSEPQTRTAEPSAAAEGTAPAAQEGQAPPSPSPQAAALQKVRTVFRAIEQMRTANYRELNELRQRHMEALRRQMAEFAVDPKSGLNVPLPKAPDPASLTKPMFQEMEQATRQLAASGAATNAESMAALSRKLAESLQQLMRHQMPQPPGRGGAARPVPPKPKGA